MNINTGGPAFPTQSKIGLNDTNTWITEIPGQSGMTLRDYFAAKAMQGMLTKHGFYDDELQLARWCYETADAMLKAREA